MDDVTSPRQLADEAPAGAAQPREKRLDARAPCALWIEIQQGEEGSYCRAENISAGGLCLLDIVTREPGAMLQLSIDLEDGGLPVRVGARVVASQLLPRGPVTHVQFDDLDGATHIRLSAFVEERLPAT